MQQTLEVTIPRTEAQALPVIDPYEALVADGSLQTLAVAEKRSRLGGHAELDLSSLSAIQHGLDGLEGDLLAVIEAGQTKFGIIDTKPEMGYEYGYFFDDARFVLADVHKDSDSSFAAYEVTKKPGTDEPAAIFLKEPDTATRIARENTGTITEQMGVTDLLANDEKLSKKHATFWLSEEGKLVVEDKKSLGGTKLTVRPKEVLSFAVDTASARRVGDNEIVRKAGNQGREIDEQYRHNNGVVRNFLLDQFTDGNLYRGSNFTTVISEAHRLAAAGNVYKRVGRQDDDNNFNENSPGRMRDWEATHTRMPTTSFVKEASRHGDNYANFAAKLNPRALEANKVFTRSVQLEGISKDDLPEEKIYLNQEGHVQYEYNYAPPEAIPLYMARIASLGSQFADEISKPQPNIDHALDLIARQYQYAAIARPFDQINNSLFMNLANMQIKLIGLKGVAHGDLDLAAQRLQPETFSRYFVDQVLNQQ